MEDGGDAPRSLLGAGRSSGFAWSERDCAWAQSAPSSNNEAINKQRSKSASDGMPTQSRGHGTRAAPEFRRPRTDLPRPFIRASLRSVWSVARRPVDGNGIYRLAVRQLIEIAGNNL